ncbi:MAG: hypothetical protein QOG53_2125 [Frankiales bacterium]|jgi:FKBP-type peptidyl-prolyl cis-trans isomerase|nr:hypothetical protein [Frankiales bacterium]
MNKQTGTAIGFLAAGAVAGGIAMATLPASAADSSSTTSTATAAAPAADRHSSTPVRSDEKAVSSTLAAKLKAAALKAVPGGTVYRVETDGDGAAYEAHMTKADGTEVTVKFDSNGNVTGTEAGMGKGGPANGSTPSSSGTTG